MIDRKALAEALATVGAIGSSLFGFDAAFRTVSGAAWQRLTQLPETCGTCNGTGDVEHQATVGHVLSACETCHGSGRLYPAELVDRIAKVIADDDLDNLGPVYLEAMLTRAVAVLDALNVGTE